MEKPLRKEKMNEDVYRFVESNNGSIIANCIAELIYYEDNGFGDWTIKEIIDFLKGVLADKIEEMRE